MINYIYDGTFEGLLTVITGAIRSNEEIKSISIIEEKQPDLFTEVRKVPTDPVLAAQFFKQLATKLSHSTIMDIVYCFLSEEAGSEKVILEYIRLLITKGEQVARNHSEPVVFLIRRTSDKVIHERDRLHGFIRFRKLNNGIYYAPIAPNHNVIQFLAPHFIARFTDQQWLIHDLKRGTGIFYDGNRCRFLPDFESAISTNTFLSLERQSGEETVYQQLWNQYFREIAILERRNKRLQRQRMPVRYWRYLIEKVE